MNQNVEYEGRNTANFTGFPIEKGEAVAGVDLLSPVGANLSPGVVVRIDGNYGFKYNYSNCAPSYCLVKIGLTQNTLNTYRKGNSAEVFFYLASSPDTQRRIKSSFYGFASAFDEVRKRVYPSK
ncbi:invasion associated locus B family protein [uncultured Ruegeria sp.]|uniref:invasion associated locus B family protein n=1 Tax=uncultured Ruegeria sp. TaxID=259304 RepID=UPI00345BCF60